MLALSAAALAFNAAPLRAPVQQQRSAGAVMETASDLEALAKDANPLVGFWDPMNLVNYDQWSQGQEASIGFLRQAELKHGRIAMAGFVGYCVQSNGISFPWKLTGDITFADIAAAGSPPEQWDALPTASKLQILGFIAFLEMVGESSAILAMQGEKHYMRGGKPGVFPKFKGWMPHPVPLELFDPFNLTSKLSAEKKAKSLIAEINNGRLAMLGMMAFLAESKVPGSVPALSGIVKPYAGEVMAPFAEGDSALPYVADMLKWSL